MATTFCSRGWLFDQDLFFEYCAKFGRFCSFTMPYLDAEYLNSLMRNALESGEPIDYKKEGWDDDPGPDVLI